MPSSSASVQLPFVIRFSASNQFHSSSSVWRVCIASSLGSSAGSTHVFVPLGAVFSTADPCSERLVVEMSHTSIKVVESESGLGLFELYGNKIATQRRPSTSSRLFVVINLRIATH